MERPENQQSVDQQRRERVDKFFANFDAHLRSQGAVVETFRRRGGKRTGPYHLLACRVNGRQESVYLGPESELVSATRARLDDLQQPLQRRRQIDRLGRQLLARRRAFQRLLDTELAVVGLSRKGSEIRGWKLFASRGGAKETN